MVYFDMVNLSWIFYWNFMALSYDLVSIFDEACSNGLFYFDVKNGNITWKYFENYIMVLK